MRLSWRDVVVGQADVVMDIYQNSIQATNSTMIVIARTKSALLADPTRQQQVSERVEGRGVELIFWRGGDLRIGSAVVVGGERRAGRLACCPCPEGGVNKYHHGGGARILHSFNQCGRVVLTGDEMTHSSDSD